MKSGMLNGILALARIPPQPWLYSPNQALLSIMLVLTWIGVGFWTIFYLAGLKGIDPALYEAAIVDGANKWRVFTRITLPLLSHVTLFIVITDTILNFLVFAPVYVLTQGGPMESTNLLMYEVYRTIIGYGQIHRGAAAATISLLIIGIFVLIEFIIIRPKEIQA
jgi:multiple sugar transport system permease protein